MRADPVVRPVAILILVLVLAGACGSESDGTADTPNAGSSPNDGLLVIEEEVRVAFEIDSVTRVDLERDIALGYLGSLASGPCGGSVENFVPTEVVSRQFVDAASGELLMIEIVATFRGDASGFVQGLQRDLGDGCQREVELSVGSGVFAETTVIPLQFDGRESEVVGWVAEVILEGDSTHIASVMGWSGPYFLILEVGGPEPFSSQAVQRLAVDAFARLEER